MCRTTDSKNYNAQVVPTYKKKQRKFFYKFLQQNKNVKVKKRQRDRYEATKRSSLVLEK